MTNTEQTQTTEGNGGNRLYRLDPAAAADLLQVSEHSQEALDERWQELGKQMGFIPNTVKNLHFIPYGEIVSPANVTGATFEAWPVYTGAGGGDAQAYVYAQHDQLISAVAVADTALADGVRDALAMAYAEGMEAQKLLNAGAKLMPGRTSGELYALLGSGGGSVSITSGWSAWANGDGGSLSNAEAPAIADVKAVSVIDDIQVLENAVNYAHQHRLSVLPVKVAQLENWLHLFKQPKNEQVYTPVTPAQGLHPVSALRQEIAHAKANGLCHAIIPMQVADDIAAIFGEGYNYTYTGAPKQLWLRPAWHELNLRSGHVVMVRDWRFAESSAADAHFKSYADLWQGLAEHSGCIIHFEPNPIDSKWAFVEVRHSNPGDAEYGVPIYASDLQAYAEENGVVAVAGREAFWPVAPSIYTSHDGPVEAQGKHQFKVAVDITRTATHYWLVEAGSADAALQQYEDGKFLPTVEHLPERSPPRIEK